VYAAERGGAGRVIALSTRPDSGAGARPRKIGRGGGRGRVIVGTRPKILGVRLLSYFLSYATIIRLRIVVILDKAYNLV